MKKREHFKHIIHPSSIRQNHSVLLLPNTLHIQNGLFTILSLYWHDYFRQMRINSLSRYHHCTFISLNSKLHLEACHQRKVYKTGLLCQLMIHLKIAENSMFLQAKNTAPSMTRIKNYYFTLL